MGSAKPEATVLVIDADPERAGRIAAILSFCEFRPMWAEDAAHLIRPHSSPRDWLAVIVGDISDMPSFRRFVEWMRADAGAPPLLLLAERKGSDRDRVIGTALCWPLSEPLRQPQLSEYLRRASQRRRHEAGGGVAGGPTGKSPAVARLRDLIAQVGASDATVLIHGESGTGKEVAARALHDRSARRERAFVALNCGAIPSELLESELFGHEKGAFTGAVTTRKGRFEMAEGGTLFLDEIGDMSLPMQVKLLRVLQERSYERVGGTKTLTTDVRIIAATHRDLEESIAKGAFREDLYYRLNVVPIEMPRLRDRATDLPELISELARLNLPDGQRPIGFTPEALAALSHHPWPGNVRELSNLIERLRVLHPGQVIGLAQLPERYGGPGSGAGTAPRTASEVVLPEEGLDLKATISRIELDLIHHALQRAGGVVAHAAQTLRMRRTTLVEKLRKYGLDRATISATDLANTKTH